MIFPSSCDLQGLHIYIDVVSSLRSLESLGVVRRQSFRGNRAVCGDMVWKQLRSKRKSINKTDILCWLRRQYLFWRKDLPQFGLISGGVYLNGDYTCDRNGANVWGLCGGNRWYGPLPLFLMKFHDTGNLCGLFKVIFLRNSRFAIVSGCQIRFSKKRHLDNSSLAVLKGLYKTHNSKAAIFHQGLLFNEHQQVSGVDFKNFRFWFQEGFFLL